MKTFPASIKALVTGATSGIGLAIARGLLARGHTVFITGRNKSKFEALMEEFRPYGDRVMGMAADLTRSSDVDHLIETALTALSHRVDLLVNNAGIAPFVEIEESTPALFDEIMSVNLRAPYLLSRAILPLMKRQGCGLIANISSVAGLEAWSGSSLYSMSKFALRALTGSLLSEGALHGVKSVAICPGYVATPLVADAPVPPEEMVQPEDILKTLLYLMELSPSAVTGDIVLKRLGGL